MKYTSYLYRCIDVYLKYLYIDASMYTYMYRRRGPQFGPCGCVIGRKTGRCATIHGRPAIYSYVDVLIYVFIAIHIYICIHTYVYRRGGPQLGPCGCIMAAKQDGAQLYAEDQLSSPIQMH